MPTIAQRILTYAYYWYNFMPLARGTAACGYTTILSLFWAAGMPVTATIPKDYQVDWEAILAQHPDQFIASVSKWLYPAAARGASAGGAVAPSGTQHLVFPEVTSLPPMNDIVGTIRNRLEALNGESYPRLR